MLNNSLKNTAEHQMSVIYLPVADASTGAGLQQVPTVPTISSQPAGLMYITGQPQLPTQMVLTPPTAGFKPSPSALSAATKVSARLGFWKRIVSRF